MKKFLLFTIGTIILLSFVSCEDEKNPETELDKNNDNQPVQISTDFKENKFTYGEEEGLLKELNACEVNGKDSLKPPCSPNFFRFFHLDDRKSLKNGFILLIKALVYSETRQVKIYQREKGDLVLVNGFNGYLIERRPSKSKFDDLVIRFGNRIDNFLHHYNCVYKWNGFKYIFDSCEAIDDRAVKKEFKDSMNIEINSMIEKEHYTF